MRIFVQQERVMCDFNTADSWVILSPIEQSIKRKIEAVGIPLKDWDINIYRGVLTGCNEAFIINSTKRKEILANCQSAEEKEKTEELIRPILRGKDIKRYGYVDNGRYLINTHNGVKGKIPRVDINDYPAVKAHLDQFWDKISKRSDKGDTPYNLRNCAYLDLFFQPHICWKAVGRNLTFSIAPSGTFLTAPASFISAGNRNDYILAYLCSKVGRYFIYQNSDTTGAGDIMLNIQSLVQFPIPPIINMEIIGKCKEIQNHFSHDIQDTLDSLIFDSYRFSKDEIEEIERY